MAGRGAPGSRQDAGPRGRSGDLHDGLGHVGAAHRDAGVATAFRGVGGGGQGLRDAGGGLGRGLPVGVGVGLEIVQFGDLEGLLGRAAGVVVLGGGGDGHGLGRSAGDEGLEASGEQFGVLAGEAGALGIALFVRDGLVVGDGHGHGGGDVGGLAGGVVGRGDGLGREGAVGFGDHDPLAFVDGVGAVGVRFGIGGAGLEDGGVLHGAVVGGAGDDDGAQAVGGLGAFQHDGGGGGLGGLLDRRDVRDALAAVEGAVGQEAAHRDDALRVDDQLAVGQVGAVQRLDEAGLDHEDGAVGDPTVALPGVAQRHVDRVALLLVDELQAEELQPLLEVHGDDADADALEDLQRQQVAGALRGRDRQRIGVGDEQDVVSLEEPEQVPLVQQVDEAVVVVAEDVGQLQGGLGGRHRRLSIRCSTTLCALRGASRGMHPYRGIRTPT